MTFTESATSTRHTLGAKVLVVLLAGIVLGYAVSVDLNEDVERGRALTMDQYVSEFEHHKYELESSGIDMAFGVFFGIVFTAAIFGSYELLAFVLAWILRTLRGLFTPPEDPVDLFGP